MLGNLAIAYLFLGGAGAGTIAIACALDLFWTHDEFGSRITRAPFESSAKSRVLTRSFFIGFAGLASGCVCLLCDLGRMDRALSLFENPSPTYLSFGSVALALLMACAAFLFLVRLLHVLAIGRPFVLVVEALAGMLSVAVMLYTGLLLRSLSSVSAWNTPLVPALFLLSSLSCGIAAVLLCAFFGLRECRLFAVPRALPAFDAAVIVFEIVAAMAFSLMTPSGVSLSGAASGDAPLEVLWWAGFVFCGLVVPLVLEAVVLRSSSPAASGNGVFFLVVLAAALVLAGGVCLRFCVVNAGGHDGLELSLPVTQQMQHSNTEGEWVL